ncbi:MAG TPA: DUF1501 domain-containing protein [Pseudomonadales bacterium]|nr:DUF1501 domain-containing protein [Pseudomonadales bacterium]
MSRRTLRPGADLGRRRVLRGLGVLPLLVAGLPARLVLAAPQASAASPRRDARFVLVLLRGGMDGLMALPAWGDPHHAGLRGDLGPQAPGQAGGALDLDGTFGLHPELRRLHGFWTEGSLLPVHAVASPYRARSHFDAQNVLDIGRVLPDRTGDGWLNRALPALRGPQLAHGSERAMALGQSTPRVLMGPNAVGSWAPDVLPAPSADTLARLRALYAADALLGPRLEAALEADAMAGVAGADGGAADRGRVEPRLAEAAGRMLAAEAGPRIAVMEVGGWDTHANQNAARWRLRVLDGALGHLRDELGVAWADTVVMVVTEFGRTVAENGTQGTDHGTGGAAFLLGGAVRGGTVLADWPGLAPGRLHEGRDLRPTLDLRSLFKGVLGEHLGVATRTLERDVFPDSASAAACRDLLRA